ncbi:hypothetical protein B0T26DRAFT_435706 [Lasiosphaeria miniovina]|uniref:Uncharacterized protein n=1 Tax=Lasiosphaeria miniovina TaxID=1954250 RepID=A0AA40DSG4_9PEZI|nr:uncharacterized protein B0T26DRAFT_435706 [Lasiosphaeria miniovina]KAK0710313.1 hypothetical protein B0T26DRAFT_435706 [Lasiosphaeria miniovina]
MLKLLFFCILSHPIQRAIRGTESEPGTPRPSLQLISRWARPNCSLCLASAAGTVHVQYQDKDPMRNIGRVGLTYLPDSEEFIFSIYGGKMQRQVLHGLLGTVYPFSVPKTRWPGPPEARPSMILSFQRAAGPRLKIAPAGSVVCTCCTCVSILL